MRRRHVFGTFAPPAVGTDFSEVPNYGDTHKLLALRADLVTSSTVANRFPHLQCVDRNGNVFWEIVAATAQTATETTHYSWVSDGSASFGGSTLIDNVSSLPLPSFWVPEQFTWKSVTTALDAGDQWQNITAIYLVGGEWEHLVMLESLEGALGI